MKDTQLQIRIDKKTKAWLKKEFKRQGFKSVSEFVLYCIGKPVDLKNGFKVQRIK